MTVSMHALAILSVAVAAIPLALIAWRLTSISLRWLLPVACCLAVIFLIQGIDTLGGRELITALIYLLAGAARQ